METQPEIIPTARVITELSRDYDGVTLHIYRVLPSGEVVIRRVAAEVSHESDN